VSLSYVGCRYAECHGIAWREDLQEVLGLIGGTADEVDEEEEDVAELSGRYKTLNPCHSHLNG
jgi:hypothetical protein